MLYFRIGFSLLFFSSSIRTYMYNIVVASYSNVTSCLPKNYVILPLRFTIIKLRSLYVHTFQLCLLSGGETDQISRAACDVLYQLSGLHFHGIFNKIILRQVVSLLHVLVREDNIHSL